MDAIVQLIRNGLCCVKDLQLLSSTPLYDPTLTAEFYVFPKPYMNKTTPLELLICLAQLYACISCSISGFKLIVNSGILKLKRLSRVSDLLREKKKSEDTKEKKDDADADTSAIVNQVAVSSIMNEANVALRSTFVGICVLPIGIAFFWYFANSLHITEAGWIGGLPALVNATIVMEVALIPLLVFMIKDAAVAFQKAKKLRGMVKEYSDKKCKDVAKIMQQFLTLDAYSLLVIKGDGGWTPFWTEGAKSGIDADAEGKMFAKEIEALEVNLKSFVSSEGALLTADKASAIESMAKGSVLEGYREYVYFLFNLIAFYGYLFGIIAFYFDDEENQPAAINYLKFGYSNADADWGGNFAGDFMWTIEPIVILASPFLIKQMTKPKATKVKSD